MEQAVVSKTRVMDDIKVIFFALFFDDGNRKHFSKSEAVVFNSTAKRKEIIDKFSNWLHEREKDYPNATLINPKIIE